VSRSWLYTQPDIRDEVLWLRALGRRAPGTSVPARHRSSDAALLRRLEASTARNRDLAGDNQRLRHQLAEARTTPRRRHPPRSRANVPRIKGKLPFHNNRSLLTTTISRHADSSTTLSPTSPPRSEHHVRRGSR
jgi:hypothetical protein